jgi:hypothetical protein
LETWRGTYEILGYALGYHEKCRPEVCPRPEDVPAGLETEFDDVCESVTETSVVQVLQEFCNTRPALNKKKQIIVQQGKRIFEKKKTLKNSNVVAHAFGAHQNCPNGFCCKRQFGNLQQNTKDMLVAVLDKKAASKAHRIVENLDSNIAESLGAAVHMTCASRRVNLHQRDGYTRQCTLAALNMDQGYGWHAEAQRSVGMRPSPVLDKYAEKIDRRRELANERKRAPRKCIRPLNADYKKETAEDSCDDDDFDETWGKLEECNIEESKLLSSPESTMFQSVVRYRMMTEAATKVLNRVSE